MMQQNPVEFYNLGKLGIIGMKGCEDIAKKIDMHLKKFNENSMPNIESFLIPTNCPRFGTGEAKAVISHSVRTYDIYIIVDPFNYGFKESYICSWRQAETYHSHYAYDV